LYYHPDVGVWKNEDCREIMKNEAELQAATALTEIFSFSAEFGSEINHSQSSI
jgi:hypothetical protein